MQAIIRFTTLLSLLIIVNVLASCNKEKLDEVLANSGPCYCYGGLDYGTFVVRIKRTNEYPVGSKILIERYGYTHTNSSTIYNSVFFSRTLPFSDTAMTMDTIKNYTQYFKWSISDINNSILSEGVTSKEITGVSTVFYQINY